MSFMYCELNARLIQQPGQHHVVTKVTASQFRSGSTMAIVIRVDAIDCGKNFVHCRKREKPFASRQYVAESGVLHDDRTPSREVLRAAFAKPAAAKTNVLI